MKKLNVALVGVSHSDVNKFKRDDIGEISVFPELGSAKEYFINEIEDVDVVFVRHTYDINYTASFLNLLKTKESYKSTVVIMLAVETNDPTLKWFYNKGFSDDVFDLHFDVEAAMGRIQSLHQVKQQEELGPTIESRKFKAIIPTSKRVFDVVVALSLLLVLSPLLVIVAIGVMIESGYPFFYKSKRVGTGYKIFDFYKFRSMRKDADKLLVNLKGQNQYAEEAAKSEDCPQCTSLGHLCSPKVITDGKVICEAQQYRNILQQRKGTFIKIANDPRVTKFGKFIRNTSIDELPQLINVLKGDMSIVGNRPLPLYEAELLTTDKWAQRFNAPAGITGLWQVEKRGAESMSEYERKELDNKYARQYSVFGDLKLLIRTIPALLQKESV